MYDYSSSSLPKYLPAQAVEAAVTWGGSSCDIRGRLSGDFLFDRDRLLVRLQPLSVKPPGYEEDYFWIEPKRLQTDVAPLLLRSELWRFPATDEHDYVVRSLLYTLVDHVCQRGVRIERTQQLTGYDELLFWISVPAQEAVAYIQSFSPVRPRCLPAQLPWELRTGEQVIHEPKAQDWGRIGHAIGQLAMWLDTRHFWWLYAWEGDRLLHGVQFSIDQKHRRAVERRFNLPPVSSPSS